MGTLGEFSPVPRTPMPAWPHCATLRQAHMRQCIQMSTAGCSPTGRDSRGRGAFRGHLFHSLAQRKEMPHASCVPPWATQSWCLGRSECPPRSLAVGCDQRGGSGTVQVLDAPQASAFSSVKWVMMISLPPPHGIAVRMQSQYIEKALPGTCCDRLWAPPPVQQCGTRRAGASAPVS